MTGPLKILRIEVDGHFHGSADVPKPWVAQIDGVDEKYGLARTFVQRLNDYRDARRARSGNTYGVVAAFPLHEGKLYEVSRLRGKPSKRYLAREFLIVEGGKTRQVKPWDALAFVERHAGPALEYVTPDETRISRVDGIGTPAACGFALVEGNRLWRLRVGAIHEVSAVGAQRNLIFVGDQHTERISQTDAIAHLAAIISSSEAA